jgi:hypothetical protein
MVLHRPVEPARLIGHLLDQLLLEAGSFYLLDRG